MRRPPQKKRRGATRARLVQFEETLVGSDYSADEAEFMKEVERYQRETGTKFPSYVEILRIARGLGWVRDPSKAMDRDPVIGDFVQPSVSEDRDVTPKTRKSIGPYRRRKKKAK